MHAMDTEAAPAPRAPGAGGQKPGLAVLALGAVGVVYGDIGTSPLYAFRAALGAVAGPGGDFTRADVLGVVSLILWALLVIVTLKYVVVLTRISNHGEGGPLALMALVRSAFYGSTLPFLFVGMVSTALFIGDSMITPAISVLSAVEGLKAVRPGFAPYVVPLTAGVIVTLFLFQSKGTAKVSALFGPVMTLWFIVLAVTGLVHIGDDPGILAALNPLHGMRFIAGHGGLAFVTLGAVFLAVTGAETLYADLGHFGRQPIQVAWIWLVFPALALNYLGQGALVLKHPEALENPFFNLVPPEQRIPLTLLASAAAVVASQGVITGTFSLVRQAVNLGLLPRLVVKHTSDAHAGQIYLPQVNYMLMICVLILVFAFRSSAGVAAAYGISVTGTMLMDAVMIFFVAWKLWDWRAGAAALFALPLVAIDAMFLSSNMLKFAHGGWVPLLVAAFLVLLMWTWVRGTIILNGRAMKRDVRLDKFIKAFHERYGDLPRVPGTAFFMVSDPALTPASLVQNIKHNRILHEKNVILSVRIEPIPYVDPAHRSIITRLSGDFSVLVMRFGFKEAPDVQEELIRLGQDPEAGLEFDWEKASVFLSRRSLRAHPRYGLPMWQDFIYILLNKHAGDPSDYYRLPIGRVIEIGRHVII